MSLLADHGIAAEKVSAFPQAVTSQMVANFAHGGAAINVLSRSIKAKLTVVDMGTITPITTNDSTEYQIINHRIANGTANFLQTEAMTSHQLDRCLQIGTNIAQQLAHDGCQLFIGGEMAIGNTTSAAAIACGLLNLPAVDLVGPGTGVDANGLQHKIHIVERSLNQHRAQALNHPTTALRIFGGFEIAALVGCYLGCAQQGIPCLIDGFICSVGPPL